MDPLFARVLKKDKLEIAQASVFWSASVHPIEGIGMSNMAGSSKTLEEVSALEPLRAKSGRSIGLGVVYRG